MRLFIGIALSPTVIAELATLTARLQSKVDSLRWTGPESWHITLQFLGSTSQEKFDCLLARLGELHLPPIPVRIDEVGIFDRAGVFFAGVTLTPELVSLKQRITAAIALCGFAPETRPFRPHITLARAKREARGHALRPLGARIQPRPTFTRFLATEFLLYESELSAAGSRYVIRARFSLAA
jgi:RNA 2',3'-cyclic 3'-phosphodiesterase